MDRVEIFTDGGCRGNPGIGAWAALLFYKGKKKQISGFEENTTNNRMELLAAIKGLSALKKKSKANVTTDSMYVKQGITKWILGWKKNKWLASNKKSVKNVDLWQELDKLTELHDVNFYWVKGHSGHKENDLVDKLVNQTMDELQKNI